MHVRDLRTFSVLWLRRCAHKDVPLRGLQGLLLLLPLHGLPQRALRLRGQALQPVLEAADLLLHRSLAAPPELGLKAVGPSAGAERRLDGRGAPLQPVLEAPVLLVQARGCQVLVVRDGALHKLGRRGDHRVQLHRQDLVYVCLQLLHGQVVGIVPEGILQLGRYEVESDHARHRDKGEDAAHPRPCSPGAHDKRCDDCVDLDQEQVELRVGEREGPNDDLLRLVVVHQSGPKLLEDACQNRRWHVEQAGIRHLHNVGLDPREDYLHFPPLREACRQNPQLLPVETHDVEEVDVVVHARNLLQSHGVQQAEEPDDGVPEAQDLVVRPPGDAGEGNEAGARVGPLGAHLVHGGGRSPVAQVRLGSAEHEAEAEHKGEAAVDIALRQYV
mmetsp:Transcript_78559/g.243716  ORF Transcript_78559/g.243716 Transcript_78559/m.243716 type:complete len:387 (-) Transcript_78559:153-1313(-)